MFDLQAVLTWLAQDAPDRDKLEKGGLFDPVDTAEVDWYPVRSGRLLPYPRRDYMIARLNQACGADGWMMLTTEIGPPSGLTTSVRGAGDDEGLDYHPWTATVLIAIKGMGIRMATGTEENADGAETAALRRAIYAFGIFADVYHLEPPGALPPFICGMPTESKEAWRADFEARLGDAMNGIDLGFDADVIAEAREVVFPELGKPTSSLRDWANQPLGIILADPKGRNFIENYVLRKGKMDEHFRWPTETSLMTAAAVAYMDVVYREAVAEHARRETQG